ncbi:MAG: hypothetical protein KME41_05785 [Candidatus Thiodiazotropha sp. (ex Lucina pensylvanica)]|nr:hypothetical protein [Candidatus Thiodiazotropha sp. (ex Lucina pensylvanica)]
MTLDELEVLQRSICGINGISEVMEFIRVYKSDSATREQNPGVSDYIHIQSIELRLGYALSALSQLANNEAINVNVENLTAGGDQ